MNLFNNTLKILTKLVMWEASIHKKEKSFLHQNSSRGLKDVSFVDEMEAT